MSKPLKVDWVNRKKPGSSNYRVGPHKKMGGTVPKDTALSTPMNTPLTKIQRRIMAKEQTKIDREARKQEKIRESAAMEIATLRSRIDDARKRAGLSLDNSPDDDSEDLLLSAKMLADMRWVYHQLDGKQKLLDMVKGDDKQFAFILKELMKYEQAIAEKKAGQSGSGNGYGFFVVIRGLEDEKALADARAENSGSGNEISLQRISIQMNNPDGSEGESKYERKEADGEGTDDDMSTTIPGAGKSTSSIKSEGDDW